MREVRADNINRVMMKVNLIPQNLNPLCGRKESDIFYKTNEKKKKKH